MSFDPNDPNGSVQTMLAVGCIAMILSLIGFIFLAVKVAEQL